MTKKIIMLGSIVLLILALSANVLAADGNEPAILLDGAEIEAAAHIDGGNVYLPLRVVGEALGYEIQWLGMDRTISIAGPGKNIMIDLNNYRISANGHVYYMSGDCQLIGDSMYIRADLFYDCFGLIVKWDRQNGIVRLESVKENAISIKTVKEASETDEIKITLQYPQIDGLADKTAQDSINSFFEKIALDARNEGLKNADEMRESGYTGSPNKFETYFDYRLKYNQNGLLSVVFMDYQYTGGAHGLTVQSSRTFNLKTGEEYKIKDLLKSDAGYVSFISDTVRDAIGERVKEGILPEYSIAPFETIKDDQDFYLSNNAVVVYFQQYEYWPYAAGIQEFPVEFSALKDMLKSDFSFLDKNVKEQTGLEDIENTGLSGEDKLYRASNEAGIQLLKKISAEEEGKNTIFSPVSLSTMLAVLADGAAGKTLSEISAIINPDQLPADELNEKYRDNINNLTSSGYEQNGKKTTLVELANSLWIEENLRVKDDFLKDANTYYGADAYNVNFADDSVVSAINRWIEDKTHNKIQNYLSEVNPQTAMMAFNSLYFNGKWQDRFDKSKTQKEDFYLSGGSPAKVDMMNDERRIGYYEDDQIQAGSFDYYGCNMLVILPKSNTEAYLSGMDYTDIDKVLDNLEYMKVKVKFPKFDFKQKNNLISHLKNMGLNSAFDSGSADFTGIADRSEGFNLYISDLSQKCTISVDEEGTEAAALTSVVLAGSAAFEENTPPEFYLNEPFIFVISDDRTGLILFIGKVENPLAQG